MQVTLNGRSTDIGSVRTVAALLSARGETARRVAVALNGEVVPRSRWETTELSGGDTIEVLAPTAGG